MKNTTFTKKELKEIEILLERDKKDISEGKNGKTFDMSVIQSTRHDLGLSQDEFAKQLGISVVTLRSWEQKKRKPSKTTMALFVMAAAMMQVKRIDESLAKNKSTVSLG